MLETGRLLTFSFRALVLVLLLPLLWITMAARYNDLLAAAANLLVPDDLTLRAVGSHILIVHPLLTPPVSVDALTLHFGLILLGVLVLAAVGLGVVERVGWLIAMGAGLFALHVVALALLTRGLLWAYGEPAPETGDTLVFSLFAVFWGLLPPVIGGAWCLLYWLPRLRERPVDSPAPMGTSDTPPA